MDVYQLLLDAASEQLDKLSSKVTDGAWFDSLLGKLKDEVNNASLEPNVAEASLESIDLLDDNKDLLLGLGVHAFKLFMFQICSGKKGEAINTYISALSNADDLIALMNAGADGIIKAKKELDALHAAAKKLAMDLLTIGVRFLIPFLLAMI
jgi:hypothetical protein